MFFCINSISTYLIGVSNDSTLVFIYRPYSPNNAMFCHLQILFTPLFYIVGSDKVADPVDEAQKWWKSRNSNYFSRPVVYAPKLLQRTGKNNSFTNLIFLQNLIWLPVENWKLKVDTGLSGKTLRHITTSECTAHQFLIR